MYTEKARTFSHSPAPNSIRECLIVAGFLPTNTSAPNVGRNPNTIHPNISKGPINEY